MTRGKSLRPKSSSSRRGKPQRWIQKADLKEDALRDYVRGRYGAKGFTKNNTIKVEVLRELAKDPNVTETTRKRARLALTMREFRKQKKKR